MTKKILCAGFLLLCVSACGQKGALYLPEKPSNSPVGVNQDKTEQADLTEENLQENPNDY